LEDLFINLLKDMYYTEKQILKALPKMAKKADSDALRQALQYLVKETEGQVERLEQVFALCDLKPSGKTCPAIKGILEEGAACPRMKQRGPLARAPAFCAIRLAGRRAPA
jgi:ferritin-like metal-binding protein YciE